MTSFLCRLRNAAFCFLLVFLGNSACQAQEWVDKMSNPDQYSFKEIQASFEEYWKNKEYEKGKGYKQFKRWEAYWENRVDEEGQFPSPGILQSEFTSFQRRNQSNSRSTPTSNWTGDGPTSSSGGYAGIGRINAVAFHPTDVNKIWIGAAGGGLWYTEDGGSSWNTNTDDLAVLGVTAIIIDPQNPNIMYIGTGDGNAQDNYSVGVLKSTDAGLTWNTTGLNWSTSNGRTIKRMIIDPDDNNTLIAATSVGIVRTTDGGANWTTEISGLFWDVEPNFNASSNTFYACTRNQIYKSTDNGDTWTNTHTFSGVNRTNLATSPANNNYVYALCSSSSGSGYNGVYRSTNQGSTFSLQSNSPNLLGYAADGSGSGGQGWYDLAFTADPADASILYVGGVNTWKSTNGGSTWTLKSHWSGGGTSAQVVHADKHIFEWQNDVLWEGNDGGIYKSTDDGDSWVDLTNGIMISQLYKIGASQTDDRVIAGLQDNGTKLLNNNGVWSDEYGGDGMECAIRSDDSDVMYLELYYGEIKRSTNGGASWQDIRGNIPSGGTNGAWVTPFVLDPNAPQTLYVGFRSMYKSTDQGSTFTAISSNLTSGRLSYIAVAPSNSDYIYTGTSNSMYRTTNGGSSWETLSIPGSGVSMIAVHPSSPNTLWATRSTYSNNSQVYKSTNGGTSWSNVTGNLPSIPANCIVYENGTSNGVYVGMDIGVYYRDDSMSDWSLFSSGLPNVEITELDINYSTNTLHAATYGRGLWSSPTNGNVPSCLSPVSLTVQPVVQGAIFSWDAPAVVPSNGYEYTITTSSTPPTSGTSTSGTSVQVGNLSYPNEYFAHVRCNCGSDGYSTWSTSTPFDIGPSCSDDFYDSGGINTDYSNNENKKWTICPSSDTFKVKLTFNSFSVEPNWDALYIHDGPSVNSPLFSSGNGGTQAGFPAGGYYGSGTIGPFESTDDSGCLTVVFRSDTYVTASGWDVDVSCDLQCTSMVSNFQDSGYGSLRHSMTCGEVPMNISFDQSMAQFSQNPIELSSPIAVTENLTINQGSSTIYKVEALDNFPIFTIAPDASLTIEKLELISDDTPSNIVIFNEGNLSVKDITIFNATNPSTANQLLLNKGTVTIDENGYFKFEKI